MKNQTSASLAFVQEIHQGPVNSPHKGPVTQKMIPFDDVIIRIQINTMMTSGRMCYDVLHNDSIHYYHDTKSIFWHKILWLLLINKTIVKKV